MDIIICNPKYKDEVLKKLENHNIGISNVYYNFMDVRQAFCEAAEMRRTAFETCTPIVDATTYTVMEKEYGYGVKLMMQTANLICSNKLNEALEQLEIFVEGVKNRKYPINEFQEQMKLIILTTMKVYEKSLKTRNMKFSNFLIFFIPEY